MFHDWSIIKLRKYIEKSPRGWGGGTLNFLYILRLGLFFGFKILKFIFFGGFQKDIFWGMKILWIFFVPIFRGYFYAFYGLFLRAR